MSFSALKKIIIPLVMSLFLTASCWAQDEQAILFEKAKTNAAQKDYTAAILLTKQLTTQYPQNLDYRLYLAQLYYWSNDTVTAQKELNEILNQNPKNRDAYDLLIKTNLSLEQYDEVINKSREGRKKFSDNLDFYSLQEALALEKQEKNKESLNVLATITKDSKFKQEAAYLETQILRKNNNTIAIGHLITDFENSTSALNISQIEYGRKIGRNTIIGRINYGATTFNHELQTEIDAYIKVNPKAYFYFNSGFAGNNGIFPQYKFGTEYFQDFKKTSSSIGARYLFFDKSNTTLLLTGHLGLNVKNWKIEYRHYLVQTNNNWLSSSILNFRRNFETTESYIQLDLQYGSLPYFLINEESFGRLNAYRIGINGKMRFEKNYFIQPIFMYEREEFIPNEYRNRYSVQVILSTRF